TWDGWWASCDLRGRVCRDDPDALLGLGGELELDLAGGGGEQGVVAAEVGAGTGEEGHPTLANDDRAGADRLAVAGLDPEPLPDAVTAVPNGAACLLVCHRSVLVALARS